MRALGAQLSQQMGVPIVVDNKPGGSYTIGTMDLVHSAPDGYTLAYGNIVSLATNRRCCPTYRDDVEKDLTLVANTLRLSNLLIVNNDLPVKTVPELVAYAKKNPGKLAFASDGNGTTAHLGVELFKAMTGTDMLHVPYKAATAAITDLIGGGVQPPDGQHAGVRPAGPGAGKREGAGHLVAPALAHLSGHSHHRRGRRAGLRGGSLGRHHRAGPHAQGRGGAPQSQRSAPRWPTRHCASASGCWAPRPISPRRSSSSSSRAARRSSGAKIIKDSGAKID